MAHRCLVMLLGAFVALMGCGPRSTPMVPYRAVPSCEVLRVTSSIEGAFVLCSDKRLFRIADKQGIEGTPIEIARAVDEVLVTGAEMCALFSGGRIACRGRHSDTAADEDHPGCPWHGAGWRTVIQHARMLTQVGAAYCALDEQGRVICWGEDVGSWVRTSCSSLELPGLPSYQCSPCGVTGQNGMPLKAVQLWRSYDGICVQRSDGEIECPPNHLGE